MRTALAHAATSAVLSAFEKALRFADNDIQEPLKLAFFRLTCTHRS
jgi:hypothetical protein